MVHEVVPMQDTDESVDSASKVLVSIIDEFDCSTIRIKM